MIYSYKKSIYDKSLGKKGQIPKGLACSYLFKNVRAYSVQIQMYLHKEE